MLYSHQTVCLEEQKRATILQKTSLKCSVKDSNLFKGGKVLKNHKMASKAVKKLAAFVEPSKN